MKKSNIAFSGFMAAILVSVGAANAATTQIASKQYVDNRETSILQTVSNTYETKENVTNLTEQVTQLGDTINNAETGLAAKVDDAVAAATEAKQTADTAQTTASGAQSAVDALETTVGNAESGLVKDVTDLKGQVSTLDSEMDSKLDSATAATTYEVLTNKTNDLATDAGSTDKYPSAKAVVDWVSNTVTEGIEINTDKIQNGAITTDKLGNGAVTGDKIGADAVNGDKIADDSIGAEHIKDGAVGSDAIADGTVTEADLNTGLASKINGKQDKNVGAENSGKILTVGAEGNITTSATIAQARVEGLTDALAAKVDDAELTTINQTIEQIEQNVTNITAPDSGLLAKKEDSANKKNSITPENKSSDTYFPTIGAMTSWVSSELSGLSELPVNPDLINEGTLPGSKLQNGAITSEKIAAGAVTTEKIADDAVTEDKLSNDVVAKIDAKADLSAVYTRQQTNDKIVEIAIQQPQNTCTSESDLCVLTLTKDRKLAWVPVTDPATAPVDAGPVMGSKNTDTTVD